MLWIPPAASHRTGAMEAHQALTLKCGMMISCCKDTQFLLKDIHIMKKMCNFAAERGQVSAPRAGHIADVICGAGRAHT